MRSLLLALALAGCAAQSSPTSEQALPLPAPNLAALTQVTSAQDVAPMRRELVFAVFGGEIPAEVPQAVDVEPRLGAAAMRAIPQGHYLIPRHPANRLAIYHAGHQQAALKDGAATVQAMLEAGYHILALDMLPNPHEPYAALDRPLEPFLRPVALGLNYALAQQSFRDVTMVGLSGGGWTTVVYAAMDPRIDRSVPVAGSWPKYLRAGQGRSTAGDFEQQLPGLGLDYLDLYLMATDGREQVQVFNSGDPCCFAGDAALGYRQFVAQRAQGMGGRFDVVIAQNDEHTVPADILPDLLR